MAYDLEQLGPIGFQDLAAALILQSFGPAVQVMGSGRDGGRDLRHRGRLSWAALGTGDGDAWEGYTVFQVKHKQRLEARPQDNATWLWRQIRGELDLWIEETKGRTPVPDYLLFVTNVPLTPVPGTGGHDQLQRAFDKYLDDLRDESRDIDAGSERRAKLARLTHVRDWRIWDGNQVQALLNLHDGVRRGVPGFFTAADLFAGLAELTDSLPLDQLEPALRSHARTTLVGECDVHFDEAGSGDGTGIPVHEVVVDLPVTVDDPPTRTSIVRHVLDRGEHILRPSLTSHSGPRHLLVAGAPGNGKTTISRFLVQAYRAAMLRGADGLSAEHQLIIEGTATALGRLGSGLPRHRRWAMRIDLAKYARDAGSSDDSTLIRYIAERVSKRSDAGDIKASTMVSWFKLWPCFLVLDGLDEVTEPTIRKRLIQRVVELVTNAEADDYDLLVVLTTRPMGYLENIAPTQFERVDLDDLDPAAAVDYGTTAAKVWLRNDLDRLDRIIGQLQSAAEDESLRHLLRTPLQVLILTIILGSSGQLAPDRFGLFWSYYDTVLKRERGKVQVGLQRILQDHAPQIQRLHERVGFELQVRSESAERSDAVLSRDELTALAWQILDEAGFKPADDDAELLQGIVQAATHRLVLIVPRGDAGYGFDVRSLQELMAAMHLTTGPHDVVRSRLRAAAASPHWRNTLIFAAGRVFAAPQDHEQRALVELVESVDNGAERRLGNVLPVGPRLALDLVDDGMVRALPKWRSRLMTVGLRILDEPAPPDMVDIARALVRFADSGDEPRRQVVDALREALGGSITARATARLAQAHVRFVAEQLGARQDTRWLDAVRESPDAGLPQVPEGRWRDFDEEIATYPGSPQCRTRLEPAALVIHGVSTAGTATANDVAAVIAALAETDSAAALAGALVHVAAYEPALIATLRRSVLPEVQRTALGDQLR